MAQIQRRDRRVYELIRAAFNFNLRDLFNKSEVRFTSSHVIGGKTVRSRDMFEWKKEQKAVYYRIAANFLPRTTISTIYTLVASREDLTQLAVNVSFNFFIDVTRLNQYVRQFLPHVRIEHRIDRVIYYLDTQQPILEIRQMLHRTVLYPKVTIGRTASEHRLEAYPEALDIIELIHRYGCGHKDNTLTTKTQLIRPNNVSNSIPFWNGNTGILLNRNGVIQSLESQFTKPTYKGWLKKMRTAHNELFLAYYLRFLALLAK